MNEGHGGWRFTDAGKLYHGRVRFDIEVPVYMHIVNPKTGRERAFTVWDDKPTMLPVTDDYLVHHHALPGDMSIVRDAGTLEAQAHFIEEALRRHFRSEMQDPATVSYTHLTLPTIYSV